MNDERLAMRDERLENFAIKREQSQACLIYAEPTHEIRAEDASILCLMRRRKTKSIVSKIDEVNSD